MKKVVRAVSLMLLMAGVCGNAFAEENENIVRQGAIRVSIRPRACFFPLFSFLPLWLHYNLNPLCVQY